MAKPDLSAATMMPRNKQLRFMLESTASKLKTKSERPLNLGKFNRPVPKRFGRRSG